jgi:Tfp pilus assembly protein PilP
VRRAGPAWAMAVLAALLLSGCTQGFEELQAWIDN